MNTDILWNTLAL